MALPSRHTYILLGGTQLKGLADAFTARHGDSAHRRLNCIVTLFGLLVEEGLTLEYQVYDQAHNGTSELIRTLGSFLTGAENASTVVMIELPIVDNDDVVELDRLATCLGLGATPQILYILFGVDALLAVRPQVIVRHPTDPMRSCQVASHLDVYAVEEN